MRGLFPIISVLVVAVLVGCGPTKVNTQVLMPAEINMSGYDRVTVGKFEGEGGEQIRQRLITQIGGTGLYDIIDRDNIAEGMSERELAQYGLVDKEDSLDEGGLIQANTLIVGDILTHNFSQSRESQVVTRYQGEQSYNVTQTRTVGTAKVTAAIKVIDLQDMRVIVPTTIPAEDTGATSWVDGNSSPNLIPDPHFQACYDQVVGAFMRKIAPYTVTVVVKLYKVGKAPATKAGINSFKLADYDGALEQFEMALDQIEADPEAKPEHKARVLYNLAVGLEYNQRFEEAIERCQQAIQLDNQKEYILSAQRMEQGLARKRELINQGIIEPDY